MKRSLALLFALLAFLPGMLVAQSDTASAKAPYVQLAFVEDPTLITITDDKGASHDAVEGMKIQSGWVIKTSKGGSAELQIKPNGSIIKISANTNFKVNSLKIAGDSASSNSFEVAAGKIRAVAAKLSGANGAPGYNLRTPTANCGVRGTDFAINVDAATGKEWLCVAEGLVDFAKDSGEKVSVAAGQFADAQAASFTPVALDPAKIDELFADLGFTKLDPLEVAKIKPVADEVAPATDANVAGDTKAAEVKKDEPKKEEPKKDDPLMAWIKKILGVEIGSVTIDGKTYSKVVASPVIRLDGFALGLYLPVIYTSDMFDASTWYHPAGNDEWSFGTQVVNGKSLWASDPLAAAGDALSDLALKIRFLEVGRQGVDPFYLKVGNLNTMTLGHGSIVSNFANDQEFPSVRKVGLNAGVTFGPLGVEGLADDLASPQVVGGRLSLALFGQFLPIGVSGVADLALVNPKELSQNPDLKNTTAARLGDPILIEAGLDTQLFNLDLGVARVQYFADANVLTAYYRDAYTANGVTVPAGLATGTIWDSNGFHSFGVETGVQGKVLVVDYRLSFQWENGLYKNGLFRSNYYRTRTDNLLALNEYLTDRNSQAATDKDAVIGIFGSAGFNLFNLLTFEGAYRWPFSIVDGKLDTSADDLLRLVLELPKGALPDFIKVSGKVSYERTKFGDTLFNSATNGSSVNLFDANTVLKGEVLYGLAEGVDLAIGISTLVVHDASGNVVYQNGVQKIAPSINLETRIGF